MQVFFGLDSGGMVTVFLERSPPPFALVVFLRGTAGN
jgi:hypothetical protein